MKTKLLVVLGLFFTFAIAFLNFYSVEKEGENNLTLDKLTNKALADGEAGLCDDIWNVTYSGTITVPPSVTVTCETGGDFECPICVWK